MTDGRPEATDAAYAQRATELAALHAQIEAVIGQERHYGIHVWSVVAQPWPGTGERQCWFRTDPHKNLDGFAIAPHSYDDLTIPPPVDVYNRDQYERACAAVGITPAADSDLGTYADRYMPPNLWDLHPLRHAEVELRWRRLAGLDREPAPQRRIAAAAAEQHERDVYAEQMRGAEAANRRCAECGTLIVGAGMNASLGLACDVDCYDAMSDHPGRYASRAAGGAR